MFAVMWGCDSLADQCEYAAHDQLPLLGHIFKRKRKHFIGKSRIFIHELRSHVYDGLFIVFEVKILAINRFPKDYRLNECIYPDKIFITLDTFEALLCYSLHENKYITVSVSTIFRQWYVSTKTGWPIHSTDSISRPFHRK